MSQVGGNIDQKEALRLYPTSFKKNTDRERQTQKFVYSEHMATQWQIDDLFSQCDENLLMEHACDETYLMVYSLVHDLGFHLRGPYLWIVLER